MLATRLRTELADWLTAHRVTHVAMEATGVYWKPRRTAASEVRTDPEG